MKMPGLRGASLPERFLTLKPDAPVIVQTAYDDIDIRFGLLRKGAYDVISKGHDEKDFLFCVEMALGDNATRLEIRAMRQKLQLEASGLMVGDENVTRPLLAELKIAAETDDPVLLEGESGTGKEVFARHIHRESRRSNGPFVRVSCASIPEDLFE